MRKVKLLIATTMISISASSYAEFVDGNLLLSRILGSDTEVAYSIGYVTGIADAAMGTRWCPTDKVTANDITELTKRLLIASPTKRGISGDVFVLKALSNTFPCSTKPTSPGSAAL